MDAHADGSQAEPDSTRVEGSPAITGAMWPGQEPSAATFQPHPTGHEPGSTRRDLLIALRRNGPAGPDSLARLLGISRTAVLQQLRVLASAGLVERRAVRHGVGRPRHVYDVTPSTRALFPAHYDSLATTVLRAVQAIGGIPLITHVLDERRGAQAASIRERFAARNLTAAPLLDRVRELAAIQDEQGYLCDLSPAGEPADGSAGGAPGPEREGGHPGPAPAEHTHDAAPMATAGDPGSADDRALRLHEHNCPIFRVAEAVPAVCEAEAQLFRDILGAGVVQETHIMAGSRCCTFRIEEASAQPATAG